MPYSDIIAVCSEIHTEHINALCWLKVEFLNVKPGGTYSDHFVLQAWNWERCSGGSTLVQCTATFYLHNIWKSPAPARSRKPIIKQWKPFFLRKV